MSSPPLPTHIVTQVWHKALPSVFVIWGLVSSSSTDGHLWRVLSIYFPITPLVNSLYFPNILLRSLYLFGTFMLSYGTFMLSYGTFLLLSTYFLVIFIVHLCYLPGNLFLLFCGNFQVLFRFLYQYSFFKSIHAYLQFPHLTLQPGSQCGRHVWHYTRF